MYTAGMNFKFVLFNFGHKHDILWNVLCVIATVRKGSNTIKNKNKVKYQYFYLICVPCSVIAFLKASLLFITKIRASAFPTFVSFYVGIFFSTLFIRVYLSI
jgi:hypothetical protein